jgi:hypothetical protein
VSQADFFRQARFPHISTDYQRFFHLAQGRSQIQGDGRLALIRQGRCHDNYPDRKNTGRDGSIATSVDVPHLGTVTDNA